ncbi:MAG: chemotaxis protein CheX [Sphingobium sp.]|nr:chemotaxis protein CheX [Sphingobium sp.]
MAMTTLTLPTRCDRPAAAALLPELRAAVMAGDVAINGTEVAHFGQAMLQLLLSARNTLAAQRQAMTVTASPAMQAALATADAEHLLDDGSTR